MLVNPFLYWMDRIYGFIVRIASLFQSLFLLYMRLTWGHQFFLVGIEKLQNISGTAKSFAELNIPHPEFHAYEVGLFETLGGILLIVGLASRLISIPLIFIMITALSTAHAENLADFRFLLDPKSLVGENPYPFLITTLMIFAFGPGKISIDGWLKRWVNNQPKY